jgi:hypothetical protein
MTACIDFAHPVFILICNCYGVIIHVHPYL